MERRVRGGAVRRRTPTVCKHFEVENISFLSLHLFCELWVEHSNNNVCPVKIELTKSRSIPSQKQLLIIFSLAIRSVVLSSPSPRPKHSAESFYGSITRNAFEFGFSMSSLRLLSVMAEEEIRSSLIHLRRSFYVSKLGEMVQIAFFVFWLRGYSLVEWALSGLNGYYCASTQSTSHERNKIAKSENSSYRRKPEFFAV